MKESNVFNSWHAANHKNLLKCRDKVVALTFSAGKDSSVCLSFMNEVREEYGFSLRAFMCAFPHHRYTDDINSRLAAYWAEKGVELTVQIPEESDEIMRGENPCRPCQNVRKQNLPGVFSYISKPVSDVVIVSGHSLWDIAAYALNRQLASELADTDDNNETSSDKRLLEISQRFYPFFTMPEGYSVFRPLVYLNQPDIHRFCLENSIPVIEEECRYSSRRPKNNLSEFFERFGYSFNYEKVFKFAEKHLNIIPLDRITNIKSGEYLAKHF